MINMADPTATSPFVLSPVMRCRGPAASLGGETGPGGSNRNPANARRVVSCTGAAAPVVLLPRLGHCVRGTVMLRSSIASTPTPIRDTHHLLATKRAGSDRWQRSTARSPHSLTPSRLGAFVALEKNRHPRGANRFQSDANLNPAIGRGLVRRDPAVDRRPTQRSIPDATPDPDVLQLPADGSARRLAHRQRPISREASKSKPRVHCAKTVAQAGPRALG